MSKDSAKAKVVEEANEPQAGPVEGLTREHVDALRRTGFTRDEVRELAVELFGGGRDNQGNTLVDKLVSDLDSYGKWDGD